MDKKDIKELLDQQTKGLQDYVEGRLDKQTKGLQDYVEGHLDQQTKGLQDYVEGRLDKQSKELHNDYERQGKFLLEQFKDQTAFIAEQHNDLKKEMKEVRKLSVATFEMVGRNTMDIEIIKQDVEFIKNSLKRKVDLDEFEALEKRVMFLEKKSHLI